MSKLFVTNFTSLMIISSVSKHARFKNLSRDKLFLTYIIGKVFTISINKHMFLQCTGMPHVQTASHINYTAVFQNEDACVTWDIRPLPTFYYTLDNCTVFLLCEQATVS